MWDVDVCVCGQRLLHQLRVCVGVCWTWSNVQSETQREAWRAPTETGSGLIRAAVACMTNERAAFQIRLHHEYHNTPTPGPGCVPDNWPRQDPGSFIRVPMVICKERWRVWGNLMKSDWSLSRGERIRPDVPRESTLRAAWRRRHHPGQLCNCGATQQESRAAAAQCRENTARQTKKTAAERS